MSTFNGILAEFPDIRIDYFRPSNSDSTPALAYFLSHVHSDHLVGLESCKSPFIYCSPGTRDILLRLEKYPHRMNFAKGILETRKQTYRHLRNLLKAIPIECPTVIELSPGNQIRVTLFDANHCVGASCFLIEDQNHAIFYTGDVRCEPWWINALTRHPVILPYVSTASSEAQSSLDCVYLDTTFVAGGKEDPLLSFPSKAAGLSELLEKISRYPKDTLFYFDAWTFGYEDVWQALASFLNTKVHVCDYRYGLYRSLANGSDPKAPEASKLVGFQCGNHFQEGCLTTGTAECRIHSCEKGTGCEIWSKDFVRITPIVSRHKGIEIAELGAGGGHGDLNQQHELECDNQLLGQLIALCTSKLSSQPQLLSGILQMLASVMSNSVSSIKLEDFTVNDNEVADSDIAINEVVSALAKMVARRKQQASSVPQDTTQMSRGTSKRPDGLPTHITFPYSRHASYNELLKLITWFKPTNIYPCTVSEDWTPASSMSFLFGHIYPRAPLFSHDQMMLNKQGSIGPAPNRLPQHDFPESPPSRYATPPEMNKRPRTSTSATAPAHYGYEDEDQGTSATKRRRTCDNWPPTELDHYSPPRTRPGRGSPIPATLDRIDDRLLVDWPPQTHAERPSNRPVKESESNAVHIQIDGIQREAGSNLKPQSDRRTLLEYGRLSPPNRDVPRGETMTDRPRTMPGPRHSDLDFPAGVHTPSRKQFSSSPASSRLAFRQEVYNALRDNQWTGLVSNNGHQYKEEEL